MKTRHGYKNATHTMAILIALFVMACSAPIFTRAAGESTYATDTQVSVNDITLTILAGGKAQSITYGATSMTVVAGSGNSLTIKTTNTNNILNNNGGLPTCDSMTITGGTVVITPGATGCPLPVTPPPTPAPAGVVLIPSASIPISNTVPTPPATQLSGGGVSNLVVPTSSFVFTKNLKKGMDDSDVAKLQVFLATHGFPVATSGWGSLAQPSTVFGSKTVAALKPFQLSVGLPATGYFGPMTRKYVNQSK